MQAILYKTVPLMALLLILTVAQDIGAATVSGRMLMQDGSPLSGGIAVAFDLRNNLPPDPEKYIQPPDYAAEIQGDGSFMLHLPQGQYYIGAIQRHNGELGPPREGDVFLLLRDEKLNSKHIEVHDNGTVDLGDLAAGETFRATSDPMHTYTSVSGRVTDTQGNPARDVTVAALLVNKDQKDMLFTAYGTDSNGEYMLKLPFGGTYNLGILDAGPHDEDTLNKFSKVIHIRTGDMLQHVDLPVQQE